MRVTSEVEVEFLRTARGYLRGRYRGPGAQPLEARSAGLTRDEQGVPVRRVLEGDLARAVLELLARGGGLNPRRYVVQGRRRQGTLFDDAVWKALAPLRFSLASFELLEVLHDHPREWLGAKLPRAKTLGDRLAFHLVLGSALEHLPLEGARRSPLSRLAAGQALEAEELAPLLVDEGFAVALRGYEDGLLESWMAAVRRTWTLGVDARGGALRAFGEGLGAHLQACVGAGRHLLLVALVRFYRSFFRDHRAPERVLEEAARGAKEFRKVSDQEAWLKDVGQLFAPATALESELERIHGLPFVEREEDERLLFDEHAARGGEAVTQAVGLHTALVGKLR